MTKTDKIIRFNWILVLIAFLLVFFSMSCVFFALKNISDEISYIHNTEKSCKLIKFPVHWEHKTRIIYATVTAYSSTRDQCDSDPFTTASGTKVRDGVVACNFLPFGTKIKFPEIYGNKIFTVEDRMADNTMIDIWFSNRQLALDFGRKILEVQILIN